MLRVARSNPASRREQLEEFELRNGINAKRSYKYGFLERWYVQYRMDIKQAKRETQEMAKLTRSATVSNRPRLRP